MLNDLGVSLLPWVKDGITIEKESIHNGYSVFTDSTRWFTIKSLIELTPERFKLEVERQDRHEKMQNELMKLVNEE
jgi:hypothetical protein